VVSGQLEDSLRRDIESYIEGRLGGIKQEIAALQSQLNESLSRLMDRQAEVQLDGGVAASITEHLRAAHNEGIEVAAAESARTKASSDMAIVKAAISEINEQPSQAEILKILVNRAAAFAPRVAFFVVKGDQNIGWRARGFEGTVGDNVVHQMSFPVAADTVVGDAARSRKTWSGGPGSHSEDHVLLNRLGDEPPTHILAVPLVVHDRSVAVLYADSANLDADAINLEAVETLVRVSGMAVELMAARTAPAQKPAPEPAAQPTPEPAPQPMPEPAPQQASQPTPELVAPPVTPPPAYEPVAEYDEITPVVEESAPFPESIQVEAEPSEGSTVAEEVRQFVEPAVEALAPPAATEPMAPAPSGPLAPPGEAPRRRYGADIELPVDVASEEERRLHNDARRFARLLVSEIKLYNEQKVVDGRSHNDLYPRLREYIDRSREMYDKRVKPEVAQRYDYFHHELVKTLAEGDEAKLGGAYPGATVLA
jgi:hypothetical protein